MTLHTDLYYQAEAWTRIFNTPGYDKLKAYNNVNLAAIFTNEDAGWTIMAYVKNLQNKDNITGAFLNSDDTGLTTNVFLNEPRLYGLRVTKQWTGDNPLVGLFGQHKAGEPYPFQLELYGDYSRFGQAHEHYAPPIATMFNSTFPAHEDAQSDLDWGSGGGARFTYTPSGKAWNISGSVRYGRAKGKTEAHAQQGVGYQCLIVPGYFKRCDNRTTGAIFLNDIYYGTFGFAGGYYNSYDAPAQNQESHTNADFMVGKDLGIGMGSGRSVTVGFSGGLAYLRLDSSADVILHARPDTEFFDLIVGQPIQTNHVHNLNAQMQARREFEGAGPSFEWRASAALAGVAESVGQVALDASLGGAVLFGKQQARVHEHRAGAYIGAMGFSGLGGDNNAIDVTPPYDTTLDHFRSKRVTVPAVNASVGLSYEIGGVKVGAGYHIERYFDAIDAGVETRKVFDRQYDGPYFKVSVGFGG
jgi:iron complex outermembrane receptor protein